MQTNLCSKLDLDGLLLGSLLVLYKEWVDICLSLPRESVSQQLEKTFLIQAKVSIFNWAADPVSPIYPVMSLMEILFLNFPISVDHASLS